jgi:hypothetical protein
MINALHIFLLQNCFKGKKCDAVIKSSTFTSKVVFNLLNLQTCTNLQMRTCTNLQMRTCNLLSCKICNFVDFQTCELAICKVVIIICNFVIFLIL